MSLKDQITKTYLEDLADCISTVEDFLHLVLRLPSEDMPDEVIPLLKNAAEIARRRCIIMDKIVTEMAETPDQKTKLAITQYLFERMNGGEA